MTLEVRSVHSRAARSSKVDTGDPGRATPPTVASKRPPKPEEVEALQFAGKASATSNPTRLWLGRQKMRQSAWVAGCPAESMAAKIGRSGKGGQPSTGAVIGLGRPSFRFPTASKSRRRAGRNGYHSSPAARSATPNRFERADKRPDWANGLPRRASLPPLKPGL